MIISKLQIGAHGRTTKYAVCADAQETGDKPAEIARFDTLELAAIVLRYLQGGRLSKADETTAKEAIKNADAPTVESKRTREAE